MANVGKITQVIGPVVDVSFEAEGAKVPNILDALVVTKENGVEIVLDLELNSFTVEALSFGKALLNWETEGLEPATYFEIEHKSPTQEFFKLGEQKEFVSLNQSKLYQFEVEDLGVGKHYFRLVQVNEGGVRSYSKSLELEISQDGFSQVLIPNPISSNSSLRIMVPKTQNIQISLFYMSGKKVSNLYSSEVKEGYYQSISMERLRNISKGIYVLDVKGIDFSLKKKVILE